MAYKWENRFYIDPDSHTESSLLCEIGININIFGNFRISKPYKMPALDINMIQSLSRELHPTSDLMSETEVSHRLFVCLSGGLRPIIFTFP